jgi:hypothetical protein
MEILTIMTTAAVSVVGTLGVTFFGHWLGLSKERQSRTRDAQYLAIRVVCALDPFISDCCNVVGDWGDEGQDGYRYARTNTPTISFPDDLNWKSIEPELMARILGLPNELIATERSLDTVMDFAATPPGYEEYFEERVFRYGQIGLATLALADEIRRTFKIPAGKFRRWDPKETLEREVTKIQKERQNAIAHAEVWQPSETAVTGQ